MVEAAAVTEPVEGGPVEGFGDRLRTVFDTLGQLCVGVDPHPYLLESWGLPDSPSGLLQFGAMVVDAAAGQVGIIKPQVAFFERHGSGGYAALEEVLDLARQSGLLVIADVKRGDVGTSVEAYGQAWLTPGSPLEVDAMTISAFQGVGSIEAPIRLAYANGKGLFVLAATSNPEARDIQTAKVSRGGSVASSIVEDVAVWNAELSAGANGSIGLVLGATVDFDEHGIDLASLTDSPSIPVLGPGFGHQGAQYSELDALYGPAAPLVVVSASRSILQAGPHGIADAVRTQAREVWECRA
ncbi:orotidine-5'-phosphate decarboxylase [Glaciihabitans sp. UYNi722]|uniref:orotidine-5'-phosphate decarboxylase n=1 Tax=Glaciihabitans sp. UYNi722 TaxID=3156344 RepID=UPI003395C7B5